MKKKLLACLLSALMLFSFAGCGGGNETTRMPADLHDAETDFTDEETDFTDEETDFTDEETDLLDGETMTASGDLGAYYVEIRDASLEYDDDENLALVVSYSWTNNSEETTSAMMSIIEIASQDGVDLDGAVFSDSSLYNAELRAQEAAPGTTVDVQCAFNLISDTSPVELVLYEASGNSADEVTMTIDPSELGFG